MRVKWSAFGERVLNLGCVFEDECFPNQIRSAELKYADSFRRSKSEMVASFISWGGRGTDTGAAFPRTVPSSEFDWPRTDNNLDRPLTTGTEV